MVCIVPLQFHDPCLVGSRHSSGHGTGQAQAEVELQREALERLERLEPLEPLSRNGTSSAGRSWGVTESMYIL